MCLAAIYWARLERIHYGNDRAGAAEIGFDDAFLYDEIPLALHMRKIPTGQVLAEEARAAFDHWREKADKIPY
jgi:tRNA(Arg) A34 adenosine deaminase TadA